MPACETEAEFVYVRKVGMRKGIKRFLDWQVMLGLVLVGLSALVYLAHYLIFRDAHHIFIYLIGDIAFVFLEVLLVTLLIHRLLGYREKISRLGKLNMVLGSFFCEVGTELLRKFSARDRQSAALRSELVFSDGMSRQGLAHMRQRIDRHEYDIVVSADFLAEVKTFLMAKRDFLLGLLGNPNLLEHESFTDMLWAVFHLTEELNYRPDLSHLPERDREHLGRDVLRSYRRLLREWVDYMGHLMKKYPYLYSLANRLNPFDTQISVEIK